VRSNPIFDELKEKLPWKNTEEDRQKRTKMFNKIDINGNGLLSYSEIEMSLKNIVKLPLELDIGPVIKRAHHVIV